VNGGPEGPHYNRIENALNEEQQRWSAERTGAEDVWRSRQRWIRRGDMLCNDDKIESNRDRRRDRSSGSNGRPLGWTVDVLGEARRMRSRLEPLSDAGEPGHADQDQHGEQYGDSGEQATGRSDGNSLQQGAYLL